MQISAKGGTTLSREPFSVINPHINWALYDTVNTPWIMKERIIFDYEFLFVKDGDMHFTIEDQSYETKPGELYLFRPGQRHSITALQGDFVIQPHVHFDLVQYDDQDSYYINYKNRDQMTEEELRRVHPDIMAELFPNFPSRLVLNDPRYVELLLFDVIQNFKNQEDPYRSLQLKWSFLKLFTYLLKEANYLSKNDHDEKEKLAEQIRNFLENNLRRQVRMEELSRLFHMDASYLGRIFREKYQISPMKYHQMLRLNKSREMLIYTNATITDVAQRMGFKTVYDFSRAFKRQEGISPAQVRK